MSVVWSEFSSNHAGVPADVPAGVPELKSKAQQSSVRLDVNSSGTAAADQLTVCPQGQASCFGGGLHLVCTW